MDVCLLKQGSWDSHTGSILHIWFFLAFSHFHWMTGVPFLVDSSKMSRAIPDDPIRL